MSGSKKLVGSTDDIVENIERYPEFVRTDKTLQKTLGNVAEWYVLIDEGGDAKFAPSKFAGYLKMTATKYRKLTNSKLPDGEKLDGRETVNHIKKLLSEDYQLVDQTKQFGRNLFGQLEEFLGEFGKRPKKNCRLIIIADDRKHVGNLAKRQTDYLSRVIVDQAVCGGRPAIAGTRVRVSDIIEMLADGATRMEILDDFPYLSEPDIAAALAYAARAADHRVIFAA